MKSTSAGSLPDRSRYDAAEPPPPSHIIEPFDLMAAEEGVEYF
jgi:hypothetical protein